MRFGLSTGRTFSLLFLLGSIFITEKVAAFDLIDQKTSFEDSKFVNIGLGLGFTGFTRQTGIQGDPGFGFRLGLGHHFNRYLSTEFNYQFSTFRFSSPDPITPSSSLKTRAVMNQEYVRFIVAYPDLLLQPYISAGFGGYNLANVSQETALSFPVNWMFPLSVGLRAYFYKNLISFNLEYAYNILRGENQPSDTLTLLGLSKLSFNTYSFMTGFVFHFF